MRELIPGVGDKTTSKRLDELFSRKTLGAVLFGAAVSKVVEKINMMIAFILIIIVFRIKVSVSMWALALVLFVWWSMEVFIFIYIYLKWENVMENIAEKGEKTKDTAGKVKEKAKEKAEEAKDKASEVKEKTEGEDN